MANQQPRYLTAIVFVLTALGTAIPARAEVVGVDVSMRRDLGSYPYEEITGKVRFAVDPKNPRNAVIADLDRAPRGPGGRVEFTADFYALKPKSGGNGVALVDVVNRGNRTIFALNRARGAGPEGVIGDGFLLKRGFTIVCIGWEFDVPARDGAIRIEAPVATEGGEPITGIVRARFTPDRADPTFTVGDLAMYVPIDAGREDSVLTVRDGLGGPVETIARDRWKLARNVVTLTGGFEPGRNYEIAYRASNPPVNGVGLAAVRDVATWLKHTPDSIAPVKYAYAFGHSQSGRFLRLFLYQGFNTDERERQVFDAVHAHIAGGAKIDLNRRWATPTAQAAYTATAFPFADASERDPVSGQTDGILDNARTRRHQPKVFYTNTDVEYWGGGRSAALVHTTADGRRDVTPPANVRLYFLAGAQHGPGPFPPTAAGAGQQKPNPTDYWWTMRALLVALDRWVREGAAPPASQFPTINGGTLVDVRNVAFPAIPGVQDPRTLTAGLRAANTLVSGGAGAGAPLPLLVPQVDADGNARAGIRLPEVAVPLATYTGWNFRARSIGGSEQLVNLLGSYVAFPRTAAEREQRRDPRQPIDARYPNRERYKQAIDAAAANLVKGGYLLADDVPAVVKRAADHWSLATTPEATSSAAR